MTDLPPARAKTEGAPDGLWAKCPRCTGMLYQKELLQNLKVCRHCGFHFRLTARERIEFTADPETFVERDAELVTSDPLSFPGYARQLETYSERTGEKEAWIWGECRIAEIPAALLVAEFGFAGGSLGAAGGERIVRAFEHALAARQPLVAVCASGGARMQEGVVSLLQMARTSAAAAALHAGGIPYVSVLVDPVTGGVLASFASLGDIIIAESGAIIGFAGPRVIEQAFKTKLPPGSHTAAFQLQHGMVDMVLPRRDIRPTLAKLLAYLA
jgi:acetyl-CoA carboxylase carboxyl transferase subunit beta